MTADMFEALNDPLQTKNILKQLQQRASQQGKETIAMMGALKSQKAQFKVKDLECFPLIKAVWKELKTTERRVQALNRQEEELMNRQHLLEKQARERCQTYRACFVDSNQHSCVL